MKSMASAELNRAIKASPFRPFRIHMGGGRSLDVLHPEMALVSPGGRIVAVYAEPDALEVVDVFMIQSIEYLSRNGRQPRRKAG